MVNPTGYTALDLIGFTDKGPYSSSENYVKNDLAHYSGNVWRCLIDDTSGIAPAEGVNWTLFIGEPTNLVERIIAPVETDPTTNSWAVGRQIIYNDNLYEVIAAISAGDALVAYEDDPTNANIKLADPVETQLLNEKATRAAADLALQNALSHRNLLDNAWFTVNQRGQSSYSTNATYTVDRWQLYTGGSTCSVTPNNSIGLTLAITSYVGAIQFQNRLDPDLSAVLDGQTVTLSAIVDNTLYSTTFEYSDTEDTTIALSIDSYLTLQFRNIPNDGDSGHIIRLVGTGTGSYAIRAVKLELGSISTLAMDTAPNYQQELAKCQRYFYRMYAGTGGTPWISIGMVWSNNTFNTIVPIPAMRTTPTITCGDLSDLVVSQGSTATNPKTVSSLGPAAFDEFKRQMTIAVHCNETDLSMGSMYALKFGTKTQKNNWIDFSADL